MLVVVTSLGLVVTSTAGTVVTTAAFVQQFSWVHFLSGNERQVLFSPETSKTHPIPHTSLSSEPKGITDQEEVCAQVGIASPVAMSCPIASKTRKRAIRLQMLSAGSMVQGLTI